MQNENSQSVEPFDYSEEPEQQPKPAVTAPTSEEAMAVAMEASAGVYKHYPWVGPLLEAAVLCPAEERRPVEVYTQWGGGKSPVGKPEDADEDKHETYSAHALRTIQGVYPWLLPLLDSSRATLLVSPGIVHTRLGMVFDIPQLIPLTHLTPFAADQRDLIH